MRFYVCKKGALNLGQFIHHPNIELSLYETGGIKVDRKEGDSSFNYFTILLTEPLLTSCVFKVDVLAVYETDRFVDVGICAKSKYDTIMNGSFINSFNSGGISYCGYSHGGGLSGNYPSTSANGVNGMKPGAHFYFKYEPGVEIKYYDDNDTINLKLDMTGKNEEYYLFAVCYHP